MINPMGQIMKVISASLPADLKPTNVVSEFVDRQFDKMFPNNDEVNLIKMLVIQFANDDPNVVLTRMIGFANDVSEFVDDISKTSTEHIEDAGEAVDLPT